jgi:cell division protein FtsN
LPIATAAAIVVVAILGWMILGRSTGAPNAAAVSAPGTARGTERSAPPVKIAPSAAASPAVTAAPPGPAAATRSPAQPAAPEKLLIVVSSFRTRDRANQVAENIVALGLPATVRSLPGWEQVVVGPYVSRQDVMAAQGRLTAAHFADTKITSTTPAPAR